MTKGHEMKNHYEAAAVLTGRILIALLFIGGAAQKMNDPAPVVALLRGFGLPGWLVWPALAFNALTGVALILGIGVRPLAFLAAGYCAVTSVFHYVPDDPWQMTIFVKNWAIAGGCLVLSVHGAGAWSVHKVLQPRP